jgi:hypothetical protein
MKKRNHALCFCVPKHHCFYTYQTAQAAVTKYYRLGWLKHRYLFSYTSNSWKSQNNVLEDLVFGEASSLHLQMATFLLCPYMTCSFYIMETEREREREKEIDL